MFECFIGKLRNGICHYISYAEDLTEIVLRISFLLARWPTALASRQVVLILFASHARHVLWDLLDILNVLMY